MLELTPKSQPNSTTQADRRDVPRAKPPQASEILQKIQPAPTSTTAEKTAGVQGDDHRPLAFLPLPASPHGSRLSPPAAEGPAAVISTGEHRKKSPDEKKSLPFFTEKLSELPKIAGLASRSGRQVHKERL
jgi:hypothetical protein